MKNNQKSWSRQAIERECAFLVCLLGICGTSFGQYGGGSGTDTDPYLIYTASQFNTIGTRASYTTKCYKLMADIDLSVYTGTQYNRIGTYNKYPFTGVLDGNGHIISNLTYDAADTNNVGLVSSLGSKGTIKNLGLVGIHVTGNQYVGGLVGYSIGTVANCYTSGSVSGDQYVGGLMGGGFDSSIITNCYATGSVSGTKSVGGLVGYDTGTVINCYATGLVSGMELVGGLTGYGAEAVNSFWDTQISGLTASAGGRGRTTQQMMQTGNYVGWNSEGQVDWVIDEGKDYPRLAWEGRLGEPIPSSTLADFLAGSGTADDPYLVSTAEQFNHIGRFPSQWAKEYRLVADINLAGTEPVMIGVSYSKPFTGVLDGNGHMISNFTNDANSTINVGLVGYLSNNGVINNLGIVDVHVTGNQYVGGLVGRTTSYKSTVSNCFVSGSVSGDWYVGGLVGWGSDRLIVTNSYAVGSVSGTKSVGGLVGETLGAVVNCYATGSVSGTELVGGLTGSGVEAVNSFWDTQISGLTTSAGGRARTTQQMMQAGNYIGWNSEGQVDWVIDEGKDYPRLAWEVSSGQPIPGHTLSDFLTGSGTEDDPYLISTAEQFNHIGRFSSQWTKEYRLVADIDLAGMEPVIIGVTYLKPFTGVLDGNGHTISNFTYDANSTTNVGLVGYLGWNDGVVKDLRLVGVHVTGTSYVGGLVGKSGGTVTNCYSSGSVWGTEHIGGLVGHNFGIVQYCYTSVHVSGIKSVGGLVGKNSDTVINCYASGSVSGNLNVGGLVGNNIAGEGNSSEVIHCYSYGPVSGNQYFVGGLVGAGGPWSVENSFWDVQTSGQSTSAGGVGKTTAEMQDFDTYMNAGWELHWIICDGKDYPRLWWENPSCN